MAYPDISRARPRPSQHWPARAMTLVWAMLISHKFHREITVYLPGFRPHEWSLLLTNGQLERRAWPNGALLRHEIP